MEKNAEKEETEGKWEVTQHWLNTLLVNSFYICFEKIRCYAASN